MIARGDTRVARGLLLGLVRSGILLLVLAGSVAGQEIRQERIRFPDGESSARVEGAIAGYDIVDYLIEAEAGATLTVTMETTNTANYFNVLPPDSVTALFVGSTSGGEGAVELPDAGEYRIRVYLMRSAARRNEAAEYALTVSIGG